MDLRKNVLSLRMIRILPKQKKIVNFLSNIKSVIIMISVDLCIKALRVKSTTDALALEIADVYGNLGFERSIVSK